ncbi:ABC-type nitrate/sulfonate/bicarbonate transport system ATPase subunit [Aequitasia blattaphilus]|uniref:ABC transporter ATP-binding protein n=1 Tax=Aequitasia blattaphilus TaxID=2949332 RepID=A0ABT1E8F6_9FIRM|nr:ABC transporter ATP-binding protein [Aequitasia blattaphilus]MCP1102118.1 ABC transporter ATP-binding protein [Aequitasia blattaphilus]MCR8614758.1 ABC transporter ATP-binding protein [Aequitasia blattaphilus]
MAKLVVENVTIAYENKNVVEDISINVSENEVVSLLGVSGVGKTTLFNIIAGLLKPDTGKIILGDEDITGTSGRLSYMLQKDLLLPYRTIEDNVSLPLRIKGMKKKEARERVQGYFAVFGLENTQKLYPHQLSGGMKQRAALLRTYIFSRNVKEIILLDEPFSALDELTKKEMYDWYLEMVKKLNLSTLFITHSIDEAILLSDRIYLMSGVPGRIVEEIVIDKTEKEAPDFELTEEFLAYKKRIINCL